METNDVIHEWRRITRALIREQEMTKAEIAGELKLSPWQFRDLLRSKPRDRPPVDEARVTAVLQELRSPFDDENLVLQNRGRVTLRAFRLSALSCR